MKIKEGLLQFLKFIFVGMLNTAVDLGVLNFLVLLFDSLEKSRSFVLYKTISFIAAVSFSYLCNKYFVFNDHNEEQSKANMRNEGKKFFIVSVVGFLLNVSISSFSFYVLSEIYNGQASWYVLTSASALSGSVVTLLWNYFGYKLWVFRN